MKTIILSFIAVLCLFTANAQWTDQTDVNTKVADSPPVDMESIATNDGKTFVVFWRNVAAPTTMELRAQLLDADGNRQFGDDGMLVSDEIPMGTYTVLWSLNVDQDGNLYIGVTGTGGNNPAYVFKIDEQGSANFGSGGLNIGNGNNVKVTPLSGGGMYVTWLDDGSFKAIVQKYDDEGNPVWDDPISVGNDSDNTSPADIFPLSDGGFIEVFHVISYGINSTLYAQRYDADGNPEWDSPTQLSDKGTVFNRNYSHIQDGDVIYYGYSASEGLRFDSYLQRLDADGSLPWGINGVDFDVNQTNYELITQIAHQEGSDYIWAICTYSNESQGQFGEYAQKFDKDSGARELTDNAKEVFAVGSAQTHQGSLQLSAEGLPVFLVASETGPAGSTKELSAVKLDGNGDFVYDEQEIPVATFDAEKTRIAFTKMINNQSVAVFAEQKTNDSDKIIYAQNFVDEMLCATPSDLDAINITQNSAEVTWTENGSAEAWEIKYGEPGFNPDSEGTLVEDTDALGETLTDLEANTTYEVYVRANCGDDDYSNWSDSMLFTTNEPPCEIPTDLDAINITQTSAEITWTENGSAEAWEIKYGEPGFNPDSEGILVEDTDALGETLTDLEVNTTYEVYVRANCGDDNYSDWSESHTFTTEDLSVSENTFKEFRYYPNPVKAALHLQGNLPLQHFAVFNLLGQKVREGTPNNTKVNVGMRDVQSGLYIIKVKMDGIQKSFKLIKR